MRRFPFTALLLAALYSLFVPFSRAQCAPLNPGKAIQRQPGGLQFTMGTLKDQNDSYNYEKGVYSTILLHWMHWNDARQNLTIGDRAGEFPGMLGSRTSHIIFVGNEDGAGIAPTETPGQVRSFQQ
jgi:hypothetical protein